MNNIKVSFISLFLLATILMVFFMPKAQYTGVDILSSLDIPMNLYNWKGREVDNFQGTDERYNFISDIFSRAYVNRYGESLLFLVLDAGNFHNPKVCYGSSGYTVTDLSKNNFDIAERGVSAYMIRMQKGKEDTLLLYWMCIEKSITDWTQQKLKELWYSLIGKKKVGLMVRLEVPIKNNNVENAVSQAQRFLTDLARKVNDSDAEYLFGEINNSSV